MYWTTLKENMHDDCANKSTLLYGDFRMGYAMGMLMCFVKAAIAYESLLKMDKNGQEYVTQISRFAIASDATSCIATHSLC